jgi:large subunit ribosomal protein L22
MKATASAQMVATSARKLGLVAGLVRGQTVVQADRVLAATPKRAAVAVRKVLSSAVANAENNYNLRKNDLSIDSVLVGPGRTLKRARPRSRGTQSPIRRRSSHLTIVVTNDIPGAAATLAPEAKPATVPTDQPNTKPAAAEAEAKPKPETSTTKPNSEGSEK